MEVQILHSLPQPQLAIFRLLSATIYPPAGRISTVQIPVLPIVLCVSFVCRSIKTRTDAGHCVLKIEKKRNCNTLGNGERALLCTSPIGRPNGEAEAEQSGVIGDGELIPTRITSVYTPPTGHGGGF